MRTSYVNVPLAFTTVVNPEAAVAALPPFGLSINLALSECHFIGAALLLRCHAEARSGRMMLKRQAKLAKIDVIQ